METRSNTEFLFGLEEYLRYTDHCDQADVLHSIARALNDDRPKICSLSVLSNHLSRSLQDRDKGLADLIHMINKADSNESVYRALLQYVGKSSAVDKGLADLIHMINKADSNESVYRALLQYVGKSSAVDKGLAGLASAVSRSIDLDDYENSLISEYLKMLDQYFQKDKIFRGVNSYIKAGLDRTVILDAFSRSQIRSKIWLIEQLESVRQTLPDPVYKNVAVFAGWFGQLKSIYDKALTYRKMRIIEIDSQACEISDYVFNLSELENHKVKAVHADINDLTLHRNGYEWSVSNFREGTSYEEKFLPDLIINTSAEHMTEDWFFQLKHKDLESQPIVAIQSNNLFDIPEHVNCVHSQDHMLKKFPMSEVLYAGELQLKGYKRVMIIGRP
jgi:hypothetical protein